jgi:hypothetical protein
MVRMKYKVKFSLWENPTSIPPTEIAPEQTGHGLLLIKCEAYNRVYYQPYGSN